MAQEYIIYCDESEQKGRHFSNFYGGALVRSQHIDHVRATIKARKHELNLYNEIKWTKVTSNYQQKYIDLLETFFDFVEADQVKIRVMFTQNSHLPVGLTARHHEQKYFILYYQFVKHAFGLTHSPVVPGGVDLRIYPDKLPDTDEQIEQFRSYIAALSANVGFRRVGLRIRKDNVAEVRSHDHDILQCLDVIAGAMHFRLNDKHKEKPADARMRGKRTRAKEAVYKYINKRVREIYPNFNVGITTGHKGDVANRWNHSYRHWLFVPSNVKIKPGGKGRK